MTAIAAALAEIDEANAADPTLHDGAPLAQLQGQLAERWVLVLDPSASDALRLAARAHHLRRWAVPRAAYPEGRPGYLKWRRDQKIRHARELGELLGAAGVDAPTVERAQAIVTKVGLGLDPEVQCFEDAVCLTFLDTQLEQIAARLERAHMIDVIGKTLKKMSKEGKALAATVTLSSNAADLVAAAVNALAVETSSLTEHSSGEQV